MLTTLAKNDAATNWSSKCVSAALSTTAPTSSAGTEVTGGSYARQTPAWGSASAGVIVNSAAIVFNVPAGQTVVGLEFYNSTPAYYDGATVTSQAFATAGTYSVTATGTFV